jgi:hypothetical protein
LIGRFAVRQNPPSADFSPQPREPTTASVEETNRSSFFKKQAEPRAPELATNLVSTDVSATATNGMADWEDKIDEVLGSDAEVAEMAQKLLELFPKFPPVGQVEAAEHLSNLLDDDHYGPMGQYLTNANMPASVLDVLMNDALNRPDSMKLPLFLEVARNPNHPNAAEAKEELEFYLDEDYGTNWVLWEEKLQQWLKENPY